MDLKESKKIKICMAIDCNLGKRPRARPIVAIGKNEWMRGLSKIINLDLAEALAIESTSKNNTFRVFRFFVFQDGGL